MSNPSIDEIKVRLKKEGIDLDSWEQQEPKIVGAGVVKAQAEMLLKLKGVLEKALEEDLQRVAALREQKVRLERGGGGV